MMHVLSTIIFSFSAFQCLAAPWEPLGLEQILKRAPGGFVCTPAAPANSCPATHCICTSSLPTPWDTFKVLDDYATLSEQVEVFGTVTSAGPPCPYTTIKDAGPSIYLVSKTEASCGPASTWTQPANEQAAPVQEAPQVTAKPTCTTLAAFCVCTGVPSPPLPRLLTPGMTCGDATISRHCTKIDISPATGSAKLTGCACAPTSLGIPQAASWAPTGVHILQPADSGTCNPDNFEATPTCKKLRDVGGGAKACNCEDWLPDNGGALALGTFENNPCAGVANNAWDAVEITASWDCSKSGDECKCSRTESPKIPEQTSSSCKKNGNSYVGPITIY